MAKQAGRTGLSIVAEPGQPTIVMTRLFAAPRRLVFEAWTKPEHVVHWWGPYGTSLSVCEIDFRPGGKYRFVLRGQDGNEYGFGGEYREIVPPERLVSTFRFDGAPEGEALVTLVLVEEGGQTRYTETVVHKTVAHRDAHLASGMEEGAGQTLDRLAEHLRTMERARA